MKKISKFLAVLLACAMTMLLLTACVGGSGTSSSAMDETILRAMNSARKEASLSEVQLEKSLSSVAKDFYENKTGRVRSVSINGQTYDVYFMVSTRWSSATYTPSEESWKAQFQHGIEAWQAVKPDSYQSTSSTMYVGNKDLKYIGVWSGTDNGQPACCIVTAFPQGVNPNRK